MRVKLEIGPLSLQRPTASVEVNLSMRLRFQLILTQKTGGYPPQQSAPPSQPSAPPPQGAQSGYPQGAQGGYPQGGAYPQAQAPYAPGYPAQQQHYPQAPPQV